MTAPKTDLADLLAQLRTELAAAEEELRVIVRRRDGLRQSVQGLRNAIEGPKPDLPRTVENSRLALSTGPSRDVPRGKEAVWRVLQEQPRRPFTVPDLLDELNERGWAPESEDPVAVLRVTVRRLMKDHPDVENVEYGVYAYNPSSTGASRQGGG